MVDSAGVGKAINKVVEQALDKGEKDAPKADAKAQEAFEQAMHQGQSTPADAPQAGQGVDVRSVSGMNAGPSATGRVDSPGDSVLHGLDKMRSSQADAARDIQKLTSGDSMSPEDMMKVKMEIDRVSFEEQATLKGTSAVENDIKQLEKPQ